MFNNAKFKSLRNNNNQDPEKSVDDWLLVCVAIKYRKAKSMIYYWFYCNLFHNSLKYSNFFGYLRHSGISYFCRMSQETDLLHCPLESIFHVCLFTYFSGVKTPFSMIQDPFDCFVLGLFCYNNCPSDYLLCVTKKSEISLVQSFPMASQIEASPLFTLIVLRPIGTGAV